MTYKKNTSYITLLSVVSAIAVVIMHTNGCYWQFSYERYWITANFLNAVCVFAVPIFFMISGATLLDYNERYSTAEFFKKRATKTVIPFFAWSFICLLLNIFCFKTVAIEDISLKYIINGLANCSFNSVYWFFWPLFCIYACIPLLAAVPKEKRRSLFTYFAVAGFIVNGLVPFVIRVFKLDIQWPLSISVASEALLYIFIGYLLKEFEAKLWHRLCIYAAALVALGFYSYGTQVLSFEAGKIIDTFKGSNNVTSICYAAGIFMLFKQVGNRIMELKWLNKAVSLLKDYTFCVYLMHMPILLAIEGVFGFDTRSIFWRVGGFVVIIPICMAITWLMRKIPVIRKIAP